MLSKRVDGSVESRSVLTTSANGRVQSLSEDNDGDGAFDKVQVFTRNADGTSSTATTHLAINGGNLGATTVSASADGLTKTTDQNISGATGNLDYRTVDTRVIAGDGARTETVESRSRNNTLLARAVTTTSADGRTSVTQSDLNGNGTIDRIEAVTITSTVGGDITTTTQVKSGDGVVHGQSVVIKSASGLVTETQSDATGTGAFTRHVDATVLNGDGSRTQTVSDHAVNGALLARSIKTTGADKKTITQTVDADGDGDADRIVTVVQNGDGSSVTTQSAFANSGALLSKSVTTTSADGLTTVTQTDLDGNGDDEAVDSDATVVNGDGSRMRTVRHLNEDGSLASETVTVTSADGLTVDAVSKRYLAGAIVAQSGSQTLVTLAGDGTRTETATVLNRDGSVAGRTVTILSADRLTRTVKTDADGNGTFERVETAVTQANGDVVTTVSTYGPNGTTLVSRRVTTAGGNGLSVTTTSDVDGNGTADATTTDVTAINADGSRTRTVTTLAANGTGLLSKVITTTSGDGLTVTTLSDDNGVGLATKTVDVTAIALDGTRTRTVSRYAPNGTTLQGQTVTVTSADGLTQTVTTDENGNGAIDGRTVSVAALGADGSSTTTTSSYASNNALTARVIKTTSADGRSVTEADDINGDGLTDRSTATVLQADGSSLATTSDFLASGALRARSEIQISADGLTKLTRTDSDGDGIHELQISDVVQRNVDGGTVETVSRSNATGTLLERTVTTVSADGLTTTVAHDANGSGSYGRTTTSQTVIGNDGSRSVTVTDVNAAAQVLRRATDVTSADGLTHTVSTDLDGNGLNDQIVTTVRQADGGTVTTVSDYTVAGALKDRATTTTSRDGLTVTTVRDTDGNGTTDLTETSQKVLNADGTTTTTVSRRNGSNVLLDKYVATASRDGITTTTNYDVDGNGSFQHVVTNSVSVNADGSRSELVATQIWDIYGGPTHHLWTSISADGLTISRSRDFGWPQNQTQSDITSINQDGSRTRTVNTYANYGDGTVLVSATQKAASADGLTTVYKSDPLGSGSYTDVLTSVRRQDGDGRSVVTETHTSITGVLKEKVTTDVSGDGRFATISRDANGDGIVDQVEVREQRLDGSTRTVVTDYSDLGAVQSQVVKEMSFDGRTETSQFDLDGDGIIDRTRTYQRTNNADGSSVATLVDLDTEAYVASLGADGNSATRIRVNGGVLWQRSTLTTLADGRTVTLVKDADGDGTNDFNETTATDAFGISTTTTNKTEKVKDASNGTLHTQVSNIVTKVGLIGRDLSLKGADKSVTTTVTYDGVQQAAVTEVTTVQLDGTSKVFGSDWFPVKTISADGLIETSWLKENYISYDSANPDHGSGWDEWDEVNTSNIIANDGSKNVSVVTNHFSSQGIARAIVRGTKKVLTSTTANGLGTVVAKCDNTYVGTWSTSVSGIGADYVIDNASTSETISGSRHVLHYNAGNHSIALGGKSNTVLLGSGASVVTVAGGSTGNTVIGSGPTDTVTYAAATTGIQVRAGTDPLAVGAYDILTNIETIIGSAQADSILVDAGNNSITGGAGNDTLGGGAGNDTLDGGTGADSMIGGAGDDSYIVDSSGDIVTEAAGGGIDKVTASVDYVLSNEVENLSLADGPGLTLISGYDGAIIGNVTPNSGAFDGGVGGSGSTNFLSGSGQYLGKSYYGISKQIAYVLVTPGSLSSNKWIGQNITIKLYARNDRQPNSASDGTLLGSINFTDNGTASPKTIVPSDTVTKWNYVWVNIIGNTGAPMTISEIQFFTGSPLAITGTGNALNNVLNGNGAANSLTGGEGDDTLDGGVGNDTLVGGLGNDSYVVDSASDVVTEATGEGTDLVRASVTYSLASYGNVENLTLTGTAAIHATGNGLNNVLTGNSGNNSLTGAGGDDTLDGGAGGDTLVGGTGNDVYSVDSASDVVTEAANEGTDLVQASVTYSLVSYGNVENLTLTGSAAINATGNGLNNVLTGNTGNNSLTGAGGDDTLDGGAGVDTLAGGLGNDIYVVDSASDVLTEATSEGTDLVQASVTYSLALYGYVENLTLTGSAAINATGNGLNNVLTGNTGNNSLDGGAGADTLIGGVGNDTYVVNTSGDSITENVGEGTDLVQASVSYSLAANVENLTLTDAAAINATGNTLDNLLTGNSAANSLTGGDGHDTLDGGAGVDTLTGGLGDDSYIVDTTTDVIVEVSGEGTDTVRSSVTFTLGTLAEVENLTLTGSATVNATGNTLANALTGNSANNVLDGGAGADTLVGGLGNDTYVVDTAGDVVIENVGEGTDLVQSSVDYALSGSVNAENLTLTGSAAINATGNALNNVLTANTANNMLDGGAGADTLIGGTGNDIYVVDNIGDVVTENAGEGSDLVQSSVAFSLDSLANVENVTLTGASAINATGNALDNVLTGNSAANNLIGATGDDTLDGGADADTLVGGLGNDSYLVDNAGDVVTEAMSEGTDLVQSSVTYSIASSDNVENLTLTGAAAINATGNTLANILIGNSANNVLTGGDGNDTLDGGVGADTMYGGLGDDTFIVDNIGDAVIEYSSSGIDTVISSISFSIATLGSVNNVILSGAGATTATGNSLVNLLVGNAGTNTISAGDGDDKLDGGGSNDTLTGGNGSDTFVLASGMGLDTITDFSATLGDKIQFNAASFGLSAGSVAPYLVLGSAAPDAAHGYFLATSSGISWDADGSGSGAAVQLAAFSAAASGLTAANFTLA